LPYIIDGHNLIGAMKEIRLEDPDDEARLAGLLRRFCSRNQRRVTVYFDRGTPAGTSPRDAGGLSIHFVRPPRSADQAILQHLSRLKGAARNWTVVSSDLEVQASARRSGAKVMTSRDFARLLTQGASSAGQEDKPTSDLSEDEVSDWERLFNRRGRRGRGE